MGNGCGTQDFADIGAACIGVTMQKDVELVMDIRDFYLDGIVPPDMTAMMQLAGDEVTLETMWALMDLAWAVTGANPETGQGMSAFYSHAVWTLNGFFTETHQESVENRKQFSDFVSRSQPARVADYGGGFGAFARQLAAKSPKTIIEIIEPYPSDIAISLTHNFENISFVRELSGQYDVIVALDVLEHVSNPLGLTHNLATHVNADGYMLLANCFYPVIKCHLPQTFYLRYFFDFIVKQMGIMHDKNLLYAKIYSCRKKLRQPSELKHTIRCCKFLYKFKECIEFFYKSAKV